MIDSLPGLALAQSRSASVQERCPVLELAGGAGPTRPPTFWAARLGCTPFYTDRSQYDRAGVLDNALIPGVTFGVQAIRKSPPPLCEGCFPETPELVMTALGDVLGTGCADCPCNPAQGVVDFVDVSAVVRKPA